MDWVDALLAIALGVQCAGCASPGRPWCPDCADRLASLVDPGWLPTATPTVACVPYADCVPEAIVAFKDRGVRALAGQLADVLAAGLVMVDQWPGTRPLALTLDAAWAGATGYGTETTSTGRAQQVPELVELHAVDRNVNQFGTEDLSGPCVSLPHTSSSAPPPAGRPWPPSHATALR